MARRKTALKPADRQRTINWHFEQNGDCKLLLVCQRHHDVYHVLSGCVDGRVSELEQRGTTCRIDDPNDDLGCRIPDLHPPAAQAVMGVEH